MLRFAVIASAITALLASAPGMANAKMAVRSAPACVGTRTVAVDEATRERAAGALLCLINGVRATRGLPALIASTTLASAAVGHSDEMVAGGYMSHSSPGGGSERTRALKTGYLRSSTCSTLLGETIAFGSGTFATPAHLVSTLMKDPVQRSTLLDRRFRDAGIGMTLGAPMPDVAGSAATVTIDVGRR